MALSKMAILPLGGQASLPQPFKRSPPAAARGLPVLAHGLPAAPGRPALASQQRLLSSLPDSVDSDAGDCATALPHGLWVGALALGVRCWQAWAAPSRDRCHQRPSRHRRRARGGEEVANPRYKVPSDVFAPCKAADSSVYGRFRGKEPFLEQEEAIDQITESLSRALGECDPRTVLLKGATGTGKTNVIAHCIKQLDKPVMLLCHNKALAKQMHGVLRGFFPDDNVELLVSPFSSYRPSYVDCSGSGGRAEYKRGFGVPDPETSARRQQALTSIRKGKLTIVVASSTALYPCRDPFMTEQDEAEIAKVVSAGIEEEIIRIKCKAAKKTVRRRYGKVDEVDKTLLDGLQKDLRCLRDGGWCPELMEKYSYFLDERLHCTPFGLFKKAYDEDWLLVVDEVHVAFPHLKTPSSGYRTKHARMVSYGYRLPSSGQRGPQSLDSLIEPKPNAGILASATPRMQYLKDLGLPVETVEMVHRPTHILDPEVSFVKRDESNQGQFYKGMVDAICGERERGSQTLISCCTQLEAEEFARFISQGILRAGFAHCNMEPSEREQVLDSFGKGELDVLVGVNLFREGLDFPRAALIYILDGPGGGFMRCADSLTQFIGRVARHPRGRAVLTYKSGPSLAMLECQDRANDNRAKQSAYNTKHGFKPTALQSEPLPRMEPPPMVHGPVSPHHEMLSEHKIKAAVMEVVGIGAERSKLLLDKSPDLAHLERTARRGRLKEVYGIGPILARRVQEGIPTIKQECRRSALRRILEEARHHWFDQQLGERRRGTQGESEHEEDGMGEERAELVAAEELLEAR